MVHQRPSPCPALPLVCREWHGYFAHENFRILVLDQYRLNMFRELVDNSRIKYVERIVLRVQLLSYECSVSEEPEDGKTARANTIIFLDTLRELTTIMSSFDASSHPGITLDLGAHSPSDGELSFRECRFSKACRDGAAQHIYKYHPQALVLAPFQTALGSSVCSGGKRVCDGTIPAPRKGSEQRTRAIIGSRYPRPDCWPIPGGDFRPVPIISALVLRRHYHRHISPIILSQFIRKGLPELQSFRNEVPLHASPQEVPSFWQKYEDVLRAFPATLSHFALYQESENPRHSMNHLMAARAIPGMLHVSTRLTSFAAAFGARADVFFREITDNNLQFPKLEHVTLTAGLLYTSVQVPSLFQVDTYLAELILRAGSTAYFRMPKLRSLIIWEGNSTRGYFIRFYYGKDRKPMMDWYCRDFRCQAGLFLALRELNRELGNDDPPRSLQVHHIAEFSELEPAGYPTDFLDVSKAIFDRESLRQLRFEREESGTNQHKPDEMHSGRTASSCILPTGR